MKEIRLFVEEYYTVVRRPRIQGETASLVTPPRLHDPYIYIRSKCAYARFCIAIVRARFCTLQLSVRRQMELLDPAAQQRMVLSLRGAITRGLPLAAEERPSASDRAILIC